MAVNVKMGVDLGGFKSGIQQGTQILKGLNAEMKATEAEFKATGNAEQKMASQTKNLTSQIQVQKGIIDQAQKALDSMTKAGIDPADKAYQQMYATMMKAQQGMYEAQAALNSLGDSAQQAAGETNELVTSVNSIGKKISLDQVISGIGSITGALETAAGKAVQLGETIWNAVMDRAKWADDTQTMALMYGIDVDTLQRMQKLVTNGLDTTVDAILNAQSRMKRGVGNGSIADDLKEIGVSMETVLGQGKYGAVTGMKDSVELFWEAGQAIMNLSDEYEKEEKAQKIFGRGWKELVPLFSEYKSVEEYQAALDKMNVSSEEDVDNLAELNDKVGELKGNLEQLSTDILAQLAPGLSTLADALNGVLTEIIEYLKTEDGQKMLQSLSDSVSSLFEDLGKIDPAIAVESFTTVFNGLVDGLKWIVDNKDTLVTALEVVVAGWAGLKITGGVLTIAKILDGLRDLGLLGAGAEKAAAASTASSSAFVTGATALLSNPVVQANAPVVGDWLMHNTIAGQELMGTAEKGSTMKALEQWQRDVEQNIKNFGKDWETLWQTITGQNTGEEPTVEVKPELPDDARETIEQELGTDDPILMRIRFQVEPGLLQPQGTITTLPGHANGLPWVPYDGYLAYLHRGERVMTASQNRNYTYNSNNYFGNVNLNNGQDIDALCDRIDRRNRRQMSGFGA